MNPKIQPTSTGQLLIDMDILSLVISIEMLKAELKQPNLILGNTPTNKNTNLIQAKDILNSARKMQRRTEKLIEFLENHIDEGSAKTIDQVWADVMMENKS